MFAIIEGTRRIGGIEIPTHKREVVSANILEVQAGTNGYQDDGGHGFEVTPGGDCELVTIITVLKFIAKVLEDGAKEVHD